MESVRVLALSLNPGIVIPQSGLLRFVDGNQSPHRVHARPKLDVRGPSGRPMSDDPMQFDRGE